jgi:Leucine-rich repeat (LRR) protein
LAPLNCSQYSNDLQIIQSLPFEITLMNETVSCLGSQCAQINSQKQVVYLWLFDVPKALQIYCLIHLDTLMIYDGAQNEPWPVPSEIGNLRNLTYLLLNNVAGDAVPETIGELKLLSSLLLRGKDVAKLPTGLANLSKLTRLDLDLPLSNLPSFLSALPLNRFDISSNARFTEVPTNFFKNLNPSLRWLEMTTSDLTSLDPFLDLTNITILFVYTDSTTVFPWQFTYLTSLNNLAFGSSQKMSSLPQNFSRTLQTLDLSSNSFTEIPSVVAQSKNLELLSMVSNFISDLTAIYTTEAPLHYLDLTANKINTISKEITRLGDRLSSLFLGGNQLQTVPAVEIVTMKKLRILDLRSNPISSSEIVRLKSIFASNPNITVLF